MNRKIVVELSPYRYLLLDPTPEGFAAAAVISSSTVYKSTEEWEYHKRTYMPDENQNVDVRVLPCVFGEAAFLAKAVKTASEADLARWKAEAARLKAEADLKASEVLRADLAAQLAALTAKASEPAVPPPPSSTT